MRLDSLFPILPRTRHQKRLENGLRVVVVEVPDAEVVSSCLWYRFGASDELPGEFGGAHFLEHMMFKGSAGYGPGEVDRRTQALGGMNNAFTSQDATAYYFSFSPPHWREGLAIEADRMRGLTLDPAEVSSERSVILEELSMYEADPWDALDQAVQTELHGDHPYARAILGTRESLADIGSTQLGDLHQRHYSPENAVLVLAGGVDVTALQAIEEAFGALESPASSRSLAPCAPRPSPGIGSAPSGSSRVQRRRGSVPRLLMAYPGPAADHPDHARLRLATGVLTAGRSSRLHRRLVEELELCQWISSDLSETVGPSTLSVAAELHTDASPQQVEELISEEVDRLRVEEVPVGELDRARRIQTSGWVFGHDQVHDLALTLGLGLALFDHEDFVEEQLRCSLEAGGGNVHTAAQHYFDPATSVVGWSLPEAEVGVL